MNAAVQKESDQQDIDERALFAQSIADDDDISEDEKTAILGEADEAPAAAAADEGDGDEAAAPAATDESKAPAVEPGEPTPAAGFDWLEDLAEEKRAKAKEFIEKQGQQIARLDQRVRSHLGQLRPAQKMITQLQRENHQLRTNPPKPQTGFDAANTLKAYSDKIDREYEDFPEEAEKLKTLFKESLDGVLQALPAPEKARVPQAPSGPDPRNELQHLSTAYSDWGERRFSPEFDGWVRTQPEDVRQLLNSPFAADNIALLDAFTQSNPSWEPPQRPEDFYSVHQAQHSPLFRGWAEAEGINPDTNFGAVPDYERDRILTRFKTDLASVYADDNGAEQHVEQQGGKGRRLAQRRSQQLKDRDPGSRRTSVIPGKPIDLDTKEGQRALFEQMIADDPDLRN